MSSPGLRERKKQKTRWSIQEHALRLFQQQGYEQTTVDQIAAAAEISPSTFFRYFKTKEDVVVEDEYDPLLLRLLADEPSDEPVIPALRHAIATAFAHLGPTEMAQIRQRTELMLAVPALRMRMLDSFHRQPGHARRRVRQPDRTGSRRPRGTHLRRCGDRRHDFGDLRLGGER